MCVCVCVFFSRWVPHLCVCVCVSVMAHILQFRLVSSVAELGLTSAGMLRFRNHPNTLICSQETFLMIINIENSSYFCGNGCILFSGSFDESSKQQHLLIWNIIFFTVTFDHFNASLLNKSINFLFTPNFWMAVKVQNLKYTLYHQIFFK